jgi:hypothetical protein
MEITRFIYQDNPTQEVDFEPTGSENVMVNATQMAAIFGKRLDVFLKTDHVAAFIKVLEFTPYGGNSAPLKRHEIIQSRGQQGTWMHRILALKFAAWLDPAFEVWVFTTIDKIINESFRMEREARLRKLSAKNEMAKLKKQMLEESSAAERYFELESIIKQADTEIKGTIRDQVRQLEMEFIPAPKLS